MQTTEIEGFDLFLDNSMDTPVMEGHCTLYLSPIITRCVDYSIFIWCIRHAGDGAYCQYVIFKWRILHDGDTNVQFILQL